jgi:hypothetical protein
MQWPAALHISSEFLLYCNNHKEIYFQEQGFSVSQ